MMKQSLYLNYALTAFLGIVAGASLMSVPQTINYFIASSEVGENRGMIIYGSLIAIEAVVYALSWFMFENKKNSFSRLICNKIKERDILSINAFTNSEEMRDKFISKNEVIVENYYKSIFMIFHFISSLVYATIAMLFINWIIAIVLLSTSMIALVISQFGNKLSTRVANELLSAKKDFNDDFVKNIDGYIYYAFAGEIDKIDTLIDRTVVRLRGKSLRSRIVSATRSSFVSFIFAFLSFAITLTAGLLILKNGASTGVFVSSTILSGFMFGAVSSMTQAYVSINSCKLINKEFREIKEYSFIDSIEGDIKVRNLNVNFDAKTIFSNFNLEVKVGQKILITGESGKGKSTLLKCMSGEIITNSVSYGNKTIDKNILSRDVVVMSNDYSFVDNEKYMQLKSSHINLLNKLDIAEIDPTNASKGELQKLKIAYVISTEAEYQFYDEPFSNIDSRSLENVIDLLNAQNKTVIVAAHNLSQKLMNKFDEKIIL